MIKVAKKRLVIFRKKNSFKLPNDINPNNNSGVTFSLKKKSQAYFSTKNFKF
jgi:hypothetical protein